jgi:rhamnogalacturonyl hydrolase YesR
LTRREAVALACSGVLAGSETCVSVESIGARLPRELPRGVAAALCRVLKQRPESINTDWFGTMPLLGLLQWCRRGVPEGRRISDAWLTHHLQTKEVAGYTGNRSRVVWAGGIPLTTYAGHFGMSQVCEEMVTQFGDSRARRVAQDIAAIVLHRTARNQIGLIGHDDTSDFAIPDVTFFAVSSLMIGAALDRANAAAFREQAVYQLRTAIATFLTRENGLAKTLYRQGGTGSTYWTRASGWLLWSITALLRRLDQADPAFAAFLPDLNRLVDGMGRVQQNDGGMHVLLDDPSTPLDSTGPAMFALGVHEAVRRRWLPRACEAAAIRAWDFVKANLTDDGVLRNTYSMWALPAEHRDMRVREETSGWAIGFVLSTANEMTMP